MERIRGDGGKLPLPGLASITGYVIGHCTECKRKLFIVTQLTFPTGKQLTVQEEKAHVLCIICKVMKDLFGGKLARRQRERFRSN